jgi:predicted glycosyltransferase
MALNSMNILVDINHPNDVHMLKNFMWVMEKKGHKIIITASKKNISYDLLNAYNFSYYKLGSYGSTLLSKMIQIPILDLKSYYTIRKLDIDILIGCNSVRNSHVSKLIGKPSITIDDSENAFLEHMLYAPFTNVIITPYFYKKDFGKKHIKFQGFNELSYLHEKYFKPDPGVLDLLNLSKDDVIILLRLVKWDANHDIGQKGFSDVGYIIDNLKEYGNVFVSSEVPDKKYKEYELKIPPEKYLDLLYYSSLYIGEGGASASEAALLGTQAIFINTITCSFLEELEKRYGIVKNIHNPKLATKYLRDVAINYLSNKNLKKEGKLIREKILNENIDITQFLVDYVENYVTSNK